jgi:Ca2+-binding EF-hand superfamily protein
MTVRVKTITLSLIASSVLTAGMFAEALPEEDDKQSRREKIEARIEAKFNEVDTNKNGVISHDEMMAKPSERFQAYDKDNDGYLTLSELPKLMPVPEHLKMRMEKRYENMRERHADRGGEGAENEAQKAEKAGRKAKMLERRQPTRLKFVARLDRDNDERLSLEEFSAPAVKRFKHSDRNGDGEVTLEEAKQAAKRKIRKHMKKRGKGHRY